MYNRVLDRRAIWVILFAGILLAGSVLLMSLYDSTFAQDAAIEYAEKGMDPVATYTAVDPEGVAIKWSLSGDDAADFTIAGGVLAFAKSPDFEDAKDADTDNIYEIMVEATDGTGHVGRKAVMVEVTNVDEDGTVELSALQPARSVPFTATLTDIDGPTGLTGSAEWQWSRSQSASGGWTDIDEATGRAYTPDVDGGDSGYYLRATAKYKDKQSPSGADNDKTASMVSANKVLALRTSNKAPEFAEIQDTMEGTTTPAIAKRTVAETATAGQLVGDPVTAEDEDANDVLTYTLVDDANTPVGSQGKFVIDRATGQISVAKSAKFNHGDDDNIDGAEGATYMVTVIATDPTGEPPAGVPAEEDITAAGAYDTVDVVITVTEVDEPPVFTVTSTDAADDVFTNVGKFAAVSFDEVTGIDTDDDSAVEGGEIGIALATFTADDAEEAEEAANEVTLGIRGADSSKFDFDPVVNQTENYTLKFKAAPDFEKPTDADKNNVYEVTITATDGNANMATRDVKVTVTNAEEDGTVTLSQPRPRVGLAITASYSDLDDGLASAEWQWWRTDENNPETAAAAVPTDLATLADGNDWLMIAGATSASYMPVDDDVDDDAPLKSDVGRYLLAVVSYTDAKQNVDEAKDMAGLVSAYSVAEDTRNRAPVFGDQDSDTPGTQNQSATREVAESAKAKDNVGNPVTATDPDPNADPLIYTLSGADAGLFKVNDEGQIMVGSGTKLNYEAAKNVYMVTLTATDSFSDSASIDVTIMVTDADEAPDVTGDATKEYAEKGMDPVATYTAVDPEGAAIAWSLSGEDAADFTIAGGVLAFVKSPNFEAPGDAGTDNIYEIMVEATDGTGHVGREAVKVEVTNVDEDGTVKLSALQPARSVPFTATLTDIDNGSDILTNIAEWQWSRSTRTSGGWTDIDKATGSGYTPDVDGGDSGYYLRATAKYKDRQSPSGADNDKTASMVSANKVLTLRLSNKAPEFAEIQDTMEGTTTPAIAKRTVAETATAGQLVGDPVTAEDEDANDVLTYTLVDDANTPVGSQGKFVIDRATGQISVAKSAKFNHGDDDNIDGAEGATYMVTVIATDPTGEPPAGVPAEEDITAAGAYDTVDVVITVTEVDEPPVFTVTSTDAADDVFTNVGKFAAVSFDEVTGIDTDDDSAVEGGEIGIALATFTADDAEEAEEAANEVTLGIRGADSSKFDFDPVVNQTENYTLKFKAAPDFEKPTDADKNNVYEVTITATDGNANMATRDVKVTVTNAEEDGTVTLSQSRPRVGLAITASYSDLDDGLASAEWQWWRTASSTLGTNPPALPDEDGLAALDAGNDWQMIADATSATYMPVAGDDSDVGRYLLAVVSYTDAKQNVGEAKDIAGLVSAYAVAEDTRNRAPVFGDQDSDTPGTQNQTAMREVAENTKANVGNAVIAEDPDPNADPLVYALSGADAALFTVTDADLVDDKGGQIEVKSGTKLDYETRTSYMVTLTATDSFGESASIDVTIMVTDVDEEPKISVGGLAITGMISVDYAEDRRDAVGTYSATGPESTNAMWSLEGDDAGDFEISSSGELTFVSAPDYENAADADMNNEYMVTVMADDGTYMATRDVTVTVTDVEEAVIDDPVALYDANDDDTIDSTEVLAAVSAYFNDEITANDVLAVVAKYFSDARASS